MYNKGLKLLRYNTHLCSYGILDRLIAVSLILNDKSNFENHIIQGSW